MGTDRELLNELHWLMDIIQSVDVGVVVVDEVLEVQVWNNFMESHSDLGAGDVIGKLLFERIPDLPAAWLTPKLKTVFELKIREFMSWEQRPYLFRFQSYRPFTGIAEHMYQNVALIPLTSIDGAVHHVAIVVYDVTDTAVNRLSLQQANQSLRDLSRTDALTQLHNRGYWEECLVREIGRVRRTKQPATLAMFDIDHFKKINDTYGHQAGDAVIQAVADTLRENSRTTDIPGRYGGEEFGVILIDTEASPSLIFAERLRAAMEQCEVVYEGQAIQFTISIGIAGLGEDMQEAAQWLQAADGALYEAKHAGRNRVVTYRADMEPAA